MFYPMLFNFDHREAGYTDDEWESIPRTDKVIIRDWHLHGGDKDQVMLFNFYETDRKIRRAVDIYELREKPLLQISLASLSLPFGNPATQPAFSF